MTETLILEVLLRYDQLNEEAKRLSEEAGKLNAEIKAYMREHELKTLTAGKVSATFSTQERTATLVEKMIERLKTLGLNEAIIQIESLDEAKVQNMIYEKRLTPQQIEDCIEVKKVEVLRISKSKK